jgi:hypothetical protein
MPKYESMFGSAVTFVSMRNQPELASDASVSEQGRRRAARAEALI